MRTVRGGAGCRGNGPLTPRLPRHYCLERPDVQEEGNPHPALRGRAAATSMRLDLTFPAALISMPEAYGQRGRRLLRSVKCGSGP